MSHSAGKNQKNPDIQGSGLGLSLAGAVGKALQTPKMPTSGMALKFHQPGFGVEGRMPRWIHSFTNLEIMLLSDLMLVSTTVKNAVCRS